MRIHHLDCGSLCPLSERLVNGAGSLFARGSMVCHCLLLETSSGLVLVDTGLGLGDCAAPAERLGRAFVAITKPALDPTQTAARQVERLGFQRRDVRHIVVTHLDLDHAGGLGDFPDARVHIYRPEHQAAMARASGNERHRYKPLQWAHGPAWALYDTHGEPWFGFSCVRALEGLPPEILLVPLVGHTRGHAGIAVDTGDGWLLHAGDAYFFHGEVEPVAPSCPPGLSLFQRLVEVDRASRLANQARLRTLARDHGDEVRITCAHDPEELTRCLARTEPAHAVAA
jgi:glyoxylase-like metal-dependent hydrolase (beta-lactamase superfamily II)